MVRNVNDAKAQFSQLVDRAHAGEEIVVAKDGEPWARLVPLTSEIVTTDAATGQLSSRCPW